MRFIHTADWHLGRLFHGVHLTGDQRHALLQLVDVAKAEMPDAILVAGDIYDRAVPPPEAVDVLDEILCRLVLDLKIPVVLIAGNHDSPERLSFGSRLLEGRRLYVVGSLHDPVVPIEFRDAFGPVHVYSVPYAEPAMVRHCLNLPDVVDHNQAMSAALDRIREGFRVQGSREGSGFRVQGSGQTQSSGSSSEIFALLNPEPRTLNPAPSIRSILLSHAYVSGGQECESERPLSVGGAGTVDAAAFAGFDYVALGHLHAPQRVGGDTIRYCGSPLKYSFDESDQTKGIDLVEMDAAGSCSIRAIPLTPRHDVRRISGKLADLLLGPTDGKSRDDYLEVTLLDDGPVLDAAGRLREVYSRVMSIRRPDAEAVAGGDRPNLRTLSDDELFAAFYQHVAGVELSAEQRAAFAATVDALRAAEREVVLAPEGVS